MRIDQINNRYKFLIIMFVVIPLFISIFYDIQTNQVENKEMYYKCNNEIIKLNETMNFYCEKSLIKYNHQTKNIEKISPEKKKMNTQIIKIINESLYSPS